mmetsp:Transcript_13367/g.15752  ORF Transcript_13367/g.15752 Transcript_13367/m.15752 type:complete len:82 (-) Transcript_13367:28-273(-)
MYLCDFSRISNCGFLSNFKDSNMGDLDFTEVLVTVAAEGFWVENALTLLIKTVAKRQARVQIFDTGMVGPSYCCNHCTFYY